ncbi:hypothetical protein [Liquorilactobacillus sicerae]|uniref:hypothetical protein n=1 Tax=Liquorilactobacillus sicerae TaxID=1416943 RepID=UPI0024811229|nr:hypothetical protein [Liquorilactobacillus sicerae]
MIRNKSIQKGKWLIILVIASFADFEGILHEVIDPVSILWTLKIMYEPKKANLAPITSSLGKVGFNPSTG